MATKYGVGDTYIQINDDNTIDIYTAGSERVTIDENGNLFLLAENPYIKWLGNYLRLEGIDDNVHVVEVRGGGSYAPRLDIFNADNSACKVRLSGNGVIYYHSLSDWTCATFRDFSDEELIKIINIQPRNDGIYHKSTKDSWAFKHIDFSKIHGAIAMRAEEDITIKGVYKWDKNKKDYIETELKYKKGDKFAFDFGSLVYAMAELVYRLSDKLNKIQEQLNAIR